MTYSRFLLELLSNSERTPKAVPEEGASHAPIRHCPNIQSTVHLLPHPHNGDGTRLQNRYFGLITKGTVG